MTIYPQVQLVTEPEDAATVLFDFNLWGPARSAIHAPDFTIGTPSILGDPDAIGVEYGPRVVSFTGEFHGYRAAALTSLSSLARLMQRSKPGWLRFQLDAFTDPVWFELLRPDPGDLSFDQVYVDRPDSDRWTVDLSLPAEPFAVGKRITHPTVALSADVADPAGCEIALPEIIGDVPAPLRIKVHPVVGISGGPGSSWLMSCAPLSADLPWEPIIWQVGTGDGFTAGTDTSAATVSADYSGGSMRSISFATDAGLVRRISGEVPATVPVGRYKVLVRVTRTDTNSTFALRFGQMVTTYHYDQPTVMMDRASSTFAHSTWVDLGEFQFPRSVPDVPPSEMGATLAPPDIALDVQRVSGTGPLNIDAFKLVPIELLGNSDRPSKTLLTYLPIFGIGATGVWDGAREAIWGYGWDDALYPASYWPRGAYPEAVPGAQNILTIMPHVGGSKPYYGSDNTDKLDDVNEVEVSYQPRWLWLADRSA